jgi:hypothetical protein
VGIFPSIHHFSDIFSQRLPVPVPVAEFIVPDWGG